MTLHNFWYVLITPPPLASHFLVQKLMRRCHKIIDHLPIRGRNVIYIFVKHFLYLVCSNVTVITILFIIFPTTIREKTFKLVLHENAIKEMLGTYCLLSTKTLSLFSSFSGTWFKWFRFWPSWTTQAWNQIGNNDLKPDVTSTSHWVQRNRVLKKGFQYKE